MNAVLLALHLLATDKIAHASVSANMVVLGLELADVKDNKWRTQTRFAVGFTVFSIGVAKELIDPVFDKKDLAADFAGIVIGQAICWRF